MALCRRPNGLSRATWPVTKQLSRRTDLAESARALLELKIGGLEAYLTRCRYRR